MGIREKSMYMYSVFVRFSNIYKTVSDVIAVRNSLLVKTVNLACTHVLFRSVHQ